MEIYKAFNASSFHWYQNILVSGKKSVKTKDGQWSQGKNNYQQRHEEMSKKFLCFILSVNNVISKINRLE